MSITEAEKLEVIKKHECTTKEAALKRLKAKINRYIKGADAEPLYPKSYYELVAFLLTALYEKIDKAILFEELPDYWVYGFDFQYDEFSLNLEHIMEYNLNDDMEYRSHRVDAVYSLITIKPATFSVEQYAKFYEVEQGTVRQWIRRGKIRTAFKEGSEWKIPELSPPPSRGYEGAQYKWIYGVDNLPEEYQYLSDYVIATFFQDRKDKSKYHVLLISKEMFGNEDTSVAATKNKELLLDAKEREKLELFMISHPQIKYCGLMI